MFYILSKVVPLFVYPLGLTALLLGTGLVLNRRRPGVTVVTGLALLTLLVGGSRIVSMVLVRSLEWQHPSLTAPAPATTSGSQMADVIVVLGGGTQQRLAPRPWHEVGEAGDRMIYAAWLYRAGIAPKVLVSGAHGALFNPGEVPEAEAMAEMLVFLGVPREDIMLESRSRNTYENAVESGRLLKARDVSRLVLVTSAMHMPRSYALFKQLDLDVIPAPTDYLLTYSDWAFYTQPDPLIQLMNLLPSAEYMEMTQKALKEYIGIAVYRLRGWL